MGCPPDCCPPTLTPAPLPPPLPSGPSHPQPYNPPFHAMNASVGKQEAALAAGGPRDAALHSGGTPNPLSDHCRATPELCLPLPHGSISDPDAGIDGAWGAWPSLIPAKACGHFPYPHRALHGHPHRLFPSSLTGCPPPYLGPSHARRGPVLLVSCLMLPVCLPLQPSPLCPAHGPELVAVA